MTRLNAGHIWWEQINSNILLLNELSGFVDRHESVLFSHSLPLAWESAYMESLLRRSHAFRAELSFHQHTLKEGQLPQDLFLSSDYIEARFALDFPFSGESLAQYVCRDSEQSLHTCLFYLRGVQPGKQLAGWVSFVEQYSRASKALPHRAIFLLDCTAALSSSELPLLRYEPGLYDCQLFAMSLMSGLENSSELHRLYLSELALQLGCIQGVDAECCAAFASIAEQLAADNPEAQLSRTKQLLERTQHSDGRGFPVASEQGIRAALWTAQMRQFFPGIEKKTLELIAANEEKIRRLLQENQVLGSNGRDRLTDPWEMDIGNLYYLMQLTVAFDRSDFELICFLREVRNELAHFNPLKAQTVLRLEKNV